jgi:4-oxalomesaconate tautomerase
VDAATVGDQQNCGNVLAGVGPFAVERGLVPATDGETTVRIRMVNSDSISVATFPTPGGAVEYRGAVEIAGVPGTAAPVVLAFTDTEGSATGSLLPTGHVRDSIEGVEATCVDNGMPVVVALASSFGLTGYETHAELAADAALLARIDAFRTEAGRLMGLGDVSNASVPKTALLAPARDGGGVCTRSFIPVQPHTSIGVLAAVSVATGMLLPGAVGHELTADWPTDSSQVDVEHPTGHLLVDVVVDGSGPPRVVRSGVVRTARKLFDGTAYPR